jgi:hypothetical protein
MKNTKFSGVVNSFKSRMCKFLGDFQGFRRLHSVKKLNLKSFDYKNELAACGIAFFAYLAVNLFDLGGEFDDLSMVVPFMLFQIVLAAVLTAILLYLFSSSYFIYTAKLLTTSVIWWYVAFAAWGVYDTFHWVSLISQEFENNFGLLLTCGSEQSQGLAELFSSDPAAKAGFAFFGGNTDELVQACKLIKNMKYIPFFVIFSELMAIGGLLVCLRSFPISNLKTKGALENNED